MVKSFLEIFSDPDLDYHYGMAKEPLTYTRSLIDKLQKDLSRIGFVATIVGFAVSLLYYGYRLAVQILGEHYFTMGVYIAISITSIAVFSVYLSTHNLKELEKRYTRERLRSFLSWALIALRVVALGFSFYQWFALGVSDFDKVVTVAMLVYLALQALLEWLKSLVFHYLDLFKLGFEEDKKTLGDDLRNVVTDYLKEALAAKFKRGKERASSMEEEAEKPMDMGPYEQKLRQELEEAHGDFSAKRLLKRAKEAREKEEGAEKKRVSLFPSFRKKSKEEKKNTGEEKENSMAQGEENQVQ